MHARTGTRRTPFEKLELLRHPREASRDQTIRSPTTKRGRKRNDKRATVSGLSVRHDESIPVNIDSSGANKSDAPPLPKNRPRAYLHVHSFRTRTPRASAPFCTASSSPVLPSSLFDPTSARVVRQLRKTGKKSTTGAPAAPPPLASLPASTRSRVCFSLIDRVNKFRLFRALQATSATFHGEKKSSQLL